MISMKDIAKKCGVSVATVSKALNGRKDIGEETRRFICEEADKLGYVSNSAARTLKTKRTYNLGVLFVDEQQSGLRHEYFAAMLEAFRHEAEQSGYDITFLNHKVGNKATTYLQHSLYKNFDGVVIACVDFSNPQVIELVNSDIPVVTIDHVFNNTTAVISDNLSGISDLVHYVYEKGHRKIAFIHGEKNTSVTANRLVSFFRTCKELGLDIPDEYVRDGVYHSTESCKAETEKLLSLKERPTCILFPDDFSALGGLTAIHQAGLKVPDDISVAGYDGIALSQVLTPKLTTYKQDTESIGRLAAQQLIKAIEEPKTTIREQINVPGVLLEGESTASPK